MSFLYLLGHYERIQTRKLQNGNRVSESPQNDPESTETTQGDNKYGEKALFMYFITNVYDIQKVVYIPIESLINLILKVKTPTKNLQFGLPVLLYCFVCRPG